MTLLACADGGLLCGPLLYALAAGVAGLIGWGACSGGDHSECDHDGEES